MEFDVNDIDWSYEDEDTCMNVIDEIIDAHKGLVGELREKLKAPKLDPAYATRKTIERLPLEKKIKLFADLFSDMLPYENSVILGYLKEKYLTK